MTNEKFLDEQTKIDYVVQLRSAPHSLNKLFEHVPEELKQLYQANQKLQI